MQVTGSTKEIEKTEQFQRHRPFKESRSANRDQSVGRISIWFETEREFGRPFNWLAVALVAGVACYFVLPQEPWFMALVGLNVIIAGLTFTYRNDVLTSWVLMMCLAFSLGLTHAKFSTSVQQSPILAEETPVIPLSGEILDIEKSEDGSRRLIISPNDWIEERFGAKPQKIRLRLASRSAKVQVGQIVEMKAKLFPPAKPVYPGGYDPRLPLFFEDIGATGYVLGTPQPIEPHSADQTAKETNAQSSFSNIQRGIDGARRAFGDFILDNFPGQSGAVALALITGERGYISDETQATIRKAGLAHVLSISGLHMMLMAGVLFWLARAFLALFTRLALNYPIKQWAAVMGMFGATFYLFFSGAAVATQRAWVAIMIMFVAMILHRRAISMRNIALAAVMIVLISPVSVIGPSFLMSFAAVTGLVATFERPIFPLSSRIEALGWYRWLWRPFHGLGVISITTIVASLSTLPFSVYFFSTFQPLGLLGNLLSLPIVTLLVMPTAVLTLLLYPFGLAQYPLEAMCFGVEIVLAICAWVAQLSWSEIIMPRFSTAGLLIVTLGGLWFALWRTPMRYMGLAAIVAGGLFGFAGEKPDMMISETGKSLALRGEDGMLYISQTGRAEQYVVSQWLIHDGDSRTTQDASIHPSKRCDLQGCVFEWKSLLIAHSITPEAIRKDCLHADILVTSHRIPSPCPHPKLIVGPAFLNEHGSTFLFDIENESRVESVNSKTTRPWMP